MAAMMAKKRPVYSGSSWGLFCKVLGLFFRRLFSSQADWIDLYRRLAAPREEILLPRRPPATEKETHERRRSTIASVGFNPLLGIEAAGKNELLRRLEEDSNGMWREITFFLRRVVLRGLKENWENNHRLVAVVALRFRVVCHGAGGWPELVNEISARVTGRTEVIYP